MLCDIGMTEANAKRFMEIVPEEALQMLQDVVVGRDRFPIRVFADKTKIPLKVIDVLNNVRFELVDLKKDSAGKKSSEDNKEATACSAELTWDEFKANRRSVPVFSDDKYELSSERLMRSTYPMSLLPTSAKACTDEEATKTSKKDSTEEDTKDSTTASSKGGEEKVEKKGIVEWNVFVGRLEPEMHDTFKAMMGVLFSDLKFNFFMGTKGNYAFMKVIGLPTVIRLELFLQDCRQMNIEGKTLFFELARGPNPRILFEG